MKTYAFDFTKNTIKIFPTRKDAASAGNGLMLASNAEELSGARTSNSDMVNLYNHFTPNAQIKKFSDRATAAKRLIALADAHGKVIQCEPSEEAAPAPASAAAPKKEKAQAKKTEGEVKRGRVSEFAGKTIHSKVDENPRREGTQGFASFKIVLATPGLTYEDYLAAGGRRQDLAWDLAHDWVAVR